MIEPEVFNDLNDNMDLAEDFIQYVIKYTGQMSRGFEILGNTIIRRRKSKPAQKEAKWRYLTN
jgi:asparaginyl-tRNA synthetase